MAIIALFVTGVFKCLRAENTVFKVQIDSEQLKQHEQQFLELLADFLPDDRSEAYDSLEAAIKAHDQEFENG